MFTNNKQIYDAVKLARNFGRVSREDFKHPGRNSRLDEIQAAILSIKLPYIDDWIDKRNEAAEYYTENIDFLDHLYVVKTPDNKKYIKAMAEKGVDCRSHYSVPCHKMGFVNDPVSLPVTEKLCSQVMSLPISENITRETQDIIIEKLKEVHDEA